MPFNIPGPPSRWPPQPYATSGWDKGGNLNQSLTALPQLDLSSQLNAILSLIKKRNQPQPQPMGPRAQAPPPQNQIPEQRGREGDQTSSLRNMQQTNEKMKIGEDMLSRNMRKIPIQMGPGGTYGVAYDWDTRSMTPGQQQMVSPQSSRFDGEGANNQSARPKNMDVPQATPQGAPDDNSAAMQRYGWGNYSPEREIPGAGSAMSPPNNYEAGKQAALTGGDQLTALMAMLMAGQQ